MSKKKKIALIILVLLIAAVFAGTYYVYNILNTVMVEPLDKEKLGVNTALDNTIVNVAFFGIDGRDDVEVEGDRTDVIMIGTLDTKTNAVKVTSVMRDTYAKICINDVQEQSEVYAGDQDGIEWEITPTTTEGETTEETEEVTDEDDIDYENQSDYARYDKINVAFNEAGVESSILTLNQNFDLNIEDYVTVDFNCLMNVVDALGGLELDIPNEEVLYWTNKFLQDSNYYGQRNDPELTSTGVQTLTGAQVLAFARIRYSDSDYGRSLRQRQVVQAIFDKVKTMDLVQVISLINSVYPYIQTSLDLNEITNYTTKILSTSNLTFEDYRIPTNKYGTSGFINEIWYLFPDTLIDNNTLLHQFIYGADTVYTPSPTVQQINDVILEAMNYEATGLTYEAAGDANESVNEQQIVTEDGTTTESPTTEVPLDSVEPTEP